jgi:hypothetical protein
MHQLLTNFFTELVRRKVIRVLSLYLAGSFVILQLADVTFEPLGLPGWSMRALIAAMLVGAPVAAILSWIFDLTSEGIVVTSSPSSDEINRLKQGRKVDIVVILALLVVVATLFFQTEFSTESTAKAPIPAVDRSIAILPFVSIGLAADSDYLADGISHNASTGSGGYFKRRVPRFQKYPDWDFLRKDVCGVVFR